MTSKAAQYFRLILLSPGIYPFYVFRDTLFARVVSPGCTRSFAAFNFSLLIKQTKKKAKLSNAIATNKRIPTPLVNESRAKQISTDASFMWGDVVGVTGAAVSIDVPRRCIA